MESSSARSAGVSSTAKAASVAWRCLGGKGMSTDEKGDAGREERRGKRGKEGGEEWRKEGRGRREKEGRSRGRDETG